MSTRRGGEVLARAPGVLWRRCLDGALIWPETAPEPSLLSPPGDLVWELLAEPVSRHDLLERVARAFADADPATVRAETEAFLDQLFRVGAVVAR